MFGKSSPRQPREAPAPSSSEHCRGSVALCTRRVSSGRGAEAACRPPSRVVARSSRALGRQRVRTARPRAVAQPSAAAGRGALIWLRVLRSTGVLLAIPPS
eukprot:scaffold412_cov388-Prasinococcus_capsulatus_cf.AAC.55